MTTPAPIEKLVLHYKCKNCRAEIGTQDGQWVDERLLISCQIAHVPNGEFSNGTMTSTCRECGSQIEWDVLAWRSAQDPFSKTCESEHSF